MSAVVPAGPGRDGAALTLTGTTPARVFIGRSGTSLRTSDLLGLRAGHAAARDAVLARFDDQLVALEALAALIVRTRADTPQVYLRRPDLGRVFDEESVAAIRAEGTPGATVQVVVGDGLSARVIGAYAPKFVQKFTSLSEARGWAVGRTLAVRHARVGLMNQVGELLKPQVVLLLIGERPGLDIQASMSAYLGYRPDRTHTDADRSLISNIHDDGIPPEHAAEESVALIERLRASGSSGVSTLLSEYQRKRLGPAGTGRGITELARKE